MIQPMHAEVDGRRYRQIPREYDRDPEIHVTQPPPTRRSWLQIGITLGMVAIVVAVSMVVTAQLPEQGQKDLLREWGPMENASLVALFAGVALLLMFVKRGVRTMLLSALFLATIAVREMDGHTAFTTGGIERTEYYVDPNVPILEKAIVLLFFVVMGYAFIVYLKDNWDRFCRGLAERHGTSWAIIIAIACFILGKLADSANRLLGRIGLSFTGDDLMKRALEESIELAGAFAFLLAVIFAVLPPRTQDDTDLEPTAR